MTVLEISAADVRSCVAAELGLAEIDGSAVSDLTLVAAVLRRNCGILCPCPAELIVRRTTDAVCQLLDTNADPKDLVEAVLNGLVVAGDLLEGNDSSNPGTSALIYVANPSFLRIGERVYILGVAEDDAPILPRDLLSQLQMKGASRYFGAKDVEARLRDLGFRELSKKRWLGPSMRGGASQVVERARARLSSDGLPGPVENATALKSATRTWRAYRDRWSSISKESGIHIIRVPRRYGSPRWCIGELENGHVIRFLPLSQDEQSLRPCDQAWLLQLALDSIRGNPNYYWRVQTGEHVVLRLGFPIPLRTHRAISLLCGLCATEIGPAQPLTVPRDIAAEIENILKEDCWLVAG